MSMPTVGSYVLAHNLRGFRSTTLRVKVTRVHADNVGGTYVFVRTADILDAGTALVLDASQVSAFPEAETVVSHPAGLVTFSEEV